MTELWAIIQGIGAVVGLATGGFILWDRAVRERPLVFIVREKLIPGSVNSVSKLRVINRSPRPLLISWRAGDDNHNFRLARDNSIRETVMAVIVGELTHIVDGNATADLELLRPDGLDAVASDNIIETRIYWAFVQPVIWRRRRSIPVRITKKAYLTLLSEDDENE